MIRGIGVGLVVLCCTLLGRVSVGQSKQRTQALTGLIEGLELMRAELLAALTPMPELLGILGMRCREPAAELFRLTAQGLFGEKSFREAWEGALADCEQLCLLQEERRTLSALGNILGKYEAEVQADAIERTKQKLELFRSLEEKDRMQKNRVSTAIGAGAGVTLAVLLL